MAELRPSLVSPHEVSKLSLAAVRSLQAAVAVLAVIGAVFGLSALLAVAHDLALLCLSPVRAL